MKKVLVIVSVLMLLASGILFAEGMKEEKPWPSDTVTVIVPYGAGGGTDKMARTITPFLEKSLGQSVVVVNRAGAAGEIGMAEMNESRPDGYTLGFISFPDNFSMAAYKEVSYDNDKFIYLAAFTETPTILIAPPNSPYKNLGEFVDYAKKNPGKLTVSESGDSHTLTTVLFEEAAGIDVTTVNFAGGGDNLNAVLGGHVDAGVMALLFAQTAIDQGCTILGIAGAKRAPAFPDVPTFKEQGFKVLMVSSRVLTVPVGTPDDIVKKLQGYMDAAGASKELENLISNGGEIYAFRTGAELDTFIKEVASDVVRICTTYKDKFVR